MIVFNVTKDKVSIKQDDTLNRGEYNVTKCKFLFSKEYDGLVKEAIFFIEEKNIGILLDENDECNIPQEAFKFRGNIEIGLYAYYTNNNKLEKRYSPSRTTKVISDGSYTSEIDNTEEITPTDKEQMNSIIKNNVEEIKMLSTNKVDKVDGYNLSENNFSNIYKKKLDGIEQNAQVNKIEKIFINDDEMPIVDKKINITIPTKLTDLKNDNYFVNDKNYVHTDNNFSHAEKEKLKELNNYDDSSLNEKIVENSNSILENKKDIQNLKETSEKNTSNINEFNKNLQNCSLITETGYKLDLSIDNSTYVMTLKLLDKNENVLSTGKIDLPIESMIINVSYDSNVKRLTFSLQNGNIINVPLNDLISGLVTEENLEEILKEYALKKDIPKNLSELKNDSNYVKNTDYATTTGAGVIKGTGAFSFIVDSEGQPKLNILNYDQYNKCSLNIFISKGTLENVITGKNLETANNKVTSVGTSSTDREYPSAKCVYKIKENVDNLKSDILETGEVSDSFIHVEDSKKNELLKLEVDGVCEQVTTSGKNLLKSNRLPITKNGITISKNDNGDIVVNGTITGIESGFVAFVIGNTFTVEEGTYTSSVQNKKDGIGLNTNGFYGSLNITMADNVNFKTATATEAQTITPQINIRYDAGTFNNYIFNPMLEKSSTANEYEPYTGGQPSPNPDYPQEIKTITDSLSVTSCNKNLFSEWISATINPDTGVLSGTPRNLTNPIEVQPSTTYTMWREDTGFGMYAIEFDKDDNWLAKNTMTSANTTQTFTTKSNTKYIRLYQYTIYTPTNKAQLEQNSKATPFEQHLETQIEANLPEGEFIGKIDDTYKDTLKVEYNEEDGRYHLNLYKGIGRELINKPATGLMNSNGTYPYFYFSREPNLKAYRFSAKLNYLSKAYNVADMANKENNNNTIQWGSNNTYIRIDKFTTTEEYIEWLNSVDLILYAPLKAPYVIDLGVVDQLLSYDKVSNVFTNSDLLPQINLKYYRNFESTVRNLKVNNETLKNELVSIENRLTALENASASTISDEEESEVVNNE